MRVLSHTRVEQRGDEHGDYELTIEVAPGYTRSFNFPLTPPKGVKAADWPVEQLRRALDKLAVTTDEQAAAEQLGTAGLPALQVVAAHAKNGAAGIAALRDVYGAADAAAHEVLRETAGRGRDAARAAGQAVLDEQLPEVIG